MKRFVSYFIGAVTVLLIAVAGNDLSFAAPQAGKWAPAQRATGYDAEAEVPYLVADLDHTVHAFTSQRVEGRVAVVYRQWTLERGWTDAVDILLSPQGGEARVSGAYLDPMGMIHVAFFGGNDLGFGLYYSKAPAAIADRAPSWSPPVLVGEGAGPLSYGAIVGDDEGNLFIVYSGRRAGLGLYAVRSADWGSTWSKPAIVFLTYSVRHLAAYIQAQLDSQAQLHVVWTVVNEAGNGDAVYYARLEEDHVTWSRPLLLAAKTEYSAERPSLIEHNGELFVTYLNGSPPARWMLRSKDSGHSWSGPVHILEGWIGGNGPAVLLHDSSNILHVLFANRTPNQEVPGQDIHGVWHSVWNGSRWSFPEAVVSGPPVSAEKGEQFAPGLPQAVVSQGNVLLVTWTNDPGGGRNGVWYSHTVLDAPELPVVALPTPLATPASTVPPTSTPPAVLLFMPSANRSPLPTPKTQSVDSPTASTEGTGGRWIFSIVPVALLISAVVGTKVLLSNRRWRW